MTYPYISKPTSLKDFLEKISRLAVPDKITQQTLASLGYKSKNDRPIISILKFIGFLNSDGAPNDNYVNFRAKEQSKTIMAKCLKSAYSELFALYEDANKRTTEELRDFFSTRTKIGDFALTLTVNTFKTLCEFADFETIIQEEKQNHGEEEKGKEPKGHQPLTQLPQGLAVNMNIQITLPITDDAKVYENIFKAIREQLFRKE